MNLKPGTLIYCPVSFMTDYYGIYEIDHAGEAFVLVRPIVSELPFNLWAVAYERIEKVFETSNLSIIQQEYPEYFL